MKNRFIPTLLSSLLGVAIVLAIYSAISSNSTTFNARKASEVSDNDPLILVADNRNASVNELSSATQPDSTQMQPSAETTEHYAAMNNFYNYIVSANSFLEDHDRITLPVQHMNTLREYLKNHESVGGLPSVGLSFTGVSLWEYNDLTIFVSDDSSVSLCLGDISWNLQNNLHLDEDSISDFRHCKFADGWLLEPNFTLSYWNLGEKMASYNLPELEITEFTVFSFQDIDTNTFDRRAVIITPNQIITASQEDCKTFDIETIFSYFVTNNGYVFYVTSQHEMYRFRIANGEIVHKASNVFCITEGIGFGDGSHIDIEYVDMERHVNTTRVS